MFQLIVAAIAILIVAVLVIASLYFGGDAYKESAVKAQYATDLQEGTQIQAAYRLQEATTGTVPTGTTDAQMQELKDAQYLRDTPEGGWVVDSNYVLYKPVAGTDQCVALNRVSKKFDPSQTYANQTPNGCPSCGDANYTDWPSCQSATAMGQ